MEKLGIARFSPRLRTAWCNNYNRIWRRIYPLYQGPTIVPSPQRGSVYRIPWVQNTMAGIGMLSVQPLCTTTKYIHSCTKESNAVHVPTDHIKAWQPNQRHTNTIVYKPPARPGGTNYTTPQDTAKPTWRRTNLNTYLTRLDLGRFLSL